MLRYEVEAQKDGPARLDVWANERAPRRVSRYLFGKFTEHLGRNVYNGIWAQILQNPGFETKNKFNQPHLYRRLRALERRLGILGLVAARDKGISPFWSACGSGATYAMDTQAFNSDHCQRIEVAADNVGGVAQPIFLPLHRVSTFDLSFCARAEGIDSIRVSIAGQGDSAREAASADVSDIGEAWTKRTCRLSVEPVGDDIGGPYWLRIQAAGPGTLWLDQVFLFPSDNIDGFDPDVIRLWREAKLPLLRFPGGNFVSGYHWKDGVGPMDKRPTKPNPAWPVAEYNHVGTDEMIMFCRAIGCEPMICVNAGNGTPREAAEWVEYCNGDTKTTYGTLRARNGHPEPHNVRLWEIGNELYGRWQIGHCTAAEYAKRYAAFHEAMRAVDPTIVPIANGHTAAWNAEVMKRHPGIVRSLSVHSLIGRPIPLNTDPSLVFRALMGFTHVYPGQLRRLAAPMRQAGIDPRLAITELQLFTRGARLPTNSSLAEALWTASIINVGIRSLGEVELITHSALVNHGGCVRKEREVVWPQPVYFTHRVYGTQSEVWPLRVKFTGPCYDVALKSLPKAQNVPMLDAVALASEDGRETTVIVVNRSPDASLRTRVSLHGFRTERRVRVRSVTGSNFVSRNTFAEQGTVSLRESESEGDPEGVEYTFPPHSLTELVFRAM